jgi:hypothetical protein
MGKRRHSDEMLPNGETVREFNRRLNAERRFEQYKHALMARVASGEFTSLPKARVVECLNWPPLVSDDSALDDETDFDLADPEDAPLSAPVKTGVDLDRPESLPPTVATLPKFDFTDSPEEEDYWATLDWVASSLGEVDAGKPMGDLDPPGPRAWGLFVRARENAKEFWAMWSAAGRKKEEADTDAEMDPETKLQTHEIDEMIAEMDRGTTEGAGMPVLPGMVEAVSDAKLRLSAKYGVPLDDDVWELLAWIH